jgi:hypothetical protein
MPIASACAGKVVWAVKTILGACASVSKDLHDAEACPNLHFLSFPVQSEPEPKKTHFPSCFTDENGSVAGAGIEPATRGFSVHCSAN